MVSCDKRSLEIFDDVIFGMSASAKWRQVEWTILHFVDGQ